MTYFAYNYHTGKTLNVCKSFATPFYPYILKECLHRCCFKSIYIMYFKTETVFSTLNFRNYVCLVSKQVNQMLYNLVCLGILIVYRDFFTKYKSKADCHKKSSKLRLSQNMTIFMVEKI